MARKNGKDRGIMQRKGRKGWWVRLYANGREQWFKCDSKSQAKAVYGRLKGEQREGKYFEKPKAVPFREIAEEYLHDVDLRRQRKGDDHARMDRWLAAFGDQDAASITCRQIEKVLSGLQADGKEPATLIRHLTVLKATFNRAKRLGLLRENPATFVRTAKPNNVLVRYLTPGQESMLLQTPSPRLSPHRHYRNAYGPTPRRTLKAYLGRRGLERWSTHNPPKQGRGEASYPYELDRCWPTEQPKGNARVFFAT